jgi:hypothetical protein
LVEQQEHQPLLVWLVVQVEVRQPQVQEVVVAQVQVSPQEEVVAVEEEVAVEEVVAVDCLASHLSCSN